MESNRQSRNPVLRGHQSSLIPGILLFQIRRRKSSTIPSWFALSAKPSKALGAGWDAGLPGTGESPGLSSLWPQEIQFTLMNCGACPPELDACQRLKKPKVPCPFTVLWSHPSHFCCVVSLDDSQTEIAHRTQSLQSSFKRRLSLKRLGQIQYSFPLPIPHSLSLHTTQSLFTLILLSVYEDFFP